MEKPPASSASSSSDDQTRIHATEASEPKGFVSEHDRVFGSSTTAEAPSNRSKTRLDYFSPDGELQRTVSRQESRFSNTTQDPFQDGFDFEKHLKQILRKVDDKGVATRQLGVTFKDLTVTGEGSGLAYNTSLGGMLTAVTRLPKAIAALRHPKHKTILNSFTGSVRPGEMLLVLGRPGSGCSSFLKTLANETDGFSGVKGTVSYDGITPKEMHKQFKGDVAYLPEDDIHMPFLTVKQTLNFAAATRAPAKDGRIKTRKETIEGRRDVLASLLGLRHTYNTKVGNDIVRGVSGGERKRVSIAELLTTGCKIGCHDNSTRGLDASTALEYTRALRIATDVANLTTILSIYQAGEQLFQLFDKVSVIYDGRMVYFGPMGEAVEYFKNMGYEPQPRQTSADFLVACTDPKGRFVREGYEGRVPQTADDFAAYWAKSELGKRNVQHAEEQLRLLAPGESNDQVDAYRASAQAEHVKRASNKSPYLISYPMMARLAMVRRYQMQMGDIGTLAIVTIAAIFQALIIGSVYYPLPNNTAGFFSRGGVMFFAILYNSFTGMAEITTSYAQRPILVRQRSFAMLRPSADMLALTIVDLPFKFATTVVFDIILYFLAGLQPSASQFFVFLLFTFITNLAMLAFFRMLAAINRREANATMMAGLGVLIVAIYTGYAIPRPSMKVWFRWLSYAQPIPFGFEAILTNEFRTLNVPCVQLVPAGPGYAGIAAANQACATAGGIDGTNLVSGSAYLLSQYGYKWSHTWRNFGFIWAYYIFFLAIALIATEFQKDEAASGGVMIFKRGRAPAELVNAIESPGVKRDEENQTENPEAVAEVSEEEKNKAADTLRAATDIFTWRNVNYDITIKGEPRRLLSGVSGYVVPGKMTALMGESGAGKTTLLNVLAQRVDMGVVTGDMLVNGKPLPKSFQRQTGYCQQQDTHMATSTVREALVFSALLRQPRTTPEAEKLEYVEEIIKLLEMEAYAEAIVGEVGMGLNVEQRKRLTIGVELAAKPALLVFLDEPTSGLDSQSSWSIMLLLRKLADHGQAILATIHQPSSELFQQFDRLLLLQKGGKTVYFGDIGKNSHTLIDYFHARTDKRCADSDNPAEYILDAIGAGASAKVDKDWYQMWNESDEAKRIQEDIDRYHAEKANEDSAADKSPDSGRNYASSIGTQLTVVTKRVFSNYSRDATYVVSKFMLNIFAGLFIGFSFWKSPADVSGLQNRLFAVFMAVVLAAPLAQQLQPKYLGLRQLYTAREKPSRMYHWSVLVFSSVVVEIPFNIVAGTLFFVCWYWTVGLPSGANRAGYAYLIYSVLFELYYASFAQFVASFSPNAMAASVLYSSLFSFVIIFNGVVQPVAQLPYFWRSWMYHLSPFTYLIDGLVSNALGGVDIRCKQDQFQIVNPPAGQQCVEWMAPYTQSSGGYAAVLDNGSCGFCQYATGDEFLTTVGMSYSHRWRNIGFMCAYIVFNYAMVFVCSWLYSEVKWGSLFAKKNKAKKNEKKNTEKVSEK
ncbi:hypothetical protein JCM3765_001744 [Sporobolomyces pararoseus]